MMQVLSNIENAESGQVSLENNILLKIPEKLQKSDQNW